MLELWLIYEEGSSIEASVAKQLDKFEMIVQANEYELSNPGKKLDSFFNSTAESFSHPEVCKSIVNIFCIMFYRLSRGICCYAKIVARDGNLFVNSL